MPNGKIMPDKYNSRRRKKTQIGQRSNSDVPNGKIIPEKNNSRRRKKT